MWLGEGHAGPVASEFHFFQRLSGGPTQQGQSQSTPGEEYTCGVPAPEGQGVDPGASPANTCPATTRPGPPTPFTARCALNHLIGCERPLEL